MDKLTEQYLLSRDYVASARLNLQHFFWRTQHGFLLHPDIGLRDESHPHIAEIGTGTGIWAIDLASILPSAHIDGFDLDLSQIPSREWIPPNVKMRKFDVYDALPDEMVGRYDVVAIRLFVCVVRGENPAPIIDMAMKMLKPGGHLQWSDVDFSTWKLEKASSSVPSETLEKLQMELPVTNPVHFPKWIGALPNKIAEAGFEQIVQHRSRTPPYMLHYEQDNYIIVFDELSSKRLQGVELHEYQKLVRKAAAEVRKGVASNIDRMTVLGRKPN